MKVVFDENFFDEIDHFHPNFDESVPNQVSQERKSNNGESQCRDCHANPA